MTDDQINKLRGLLSSMAVRSVRPPRFRGAEPSDGRLVVRCEDVESKGWLESALIRLTEQEGVIFRPVPDSEIAPLPRVIMYLDKCLSTVHISEILKSLERANNNVNTREWRIMSGLRMNNWDISYQLAIPVSSMTLLRSRGLRLNLGLGLAKFVERPAEGQAEGRQE